MVDKIDNTSTLDEAIKISIQIQLSAAPSEVKRPLIKLIEAKIALLRARQQLGEAYVVSSELKEGDIK